MCVLPGRPSGLLSGIKSVGVPKGEQLLGPMLPPVVSRGRLRCVRVRDARLIKDQVPCPGQN